MYGSQKMERHGGDAFGTRWDGLHTHVLEELVHAWQCGFRVVLENRHAQLVHVVSCNTPRRH
ncbi:hypothetical protein E2C01_001102 [Portunus trituberculatus]|uniref:Uncharacterized protein n=1 Tax=Portunus trituberculatus TaxID=210409 RepID=A0A5B7CJK3_PORTR|nr:hypothetical protein [Portunus trituberculatus]